ncbi:MAG: hypothetical protein HYZ13_06155 [Acidobacteria bacterium]|nr:hypothetical protein [Acidobacteriota bacterium]
MYETPQASPFDPALEPAPGAKAAKVCGILAICFALTCLGIPVAIILGIVAVVQQAKAKRAVQAEPGRFAPVPATGLVTGILGLVLAAVILPFVGIVSALAIPGLLNQRGQARSRALRMNLGSVMQDLVTRQNTLASEGVPTDQWAGEFDKVLEVSAPALRNPVDPALPSMEAHVRVVDAGTPEEAEAAARASAVRPGVLTFVVSLPRTDGRLTGFLAGAAQTAAPRGMPPVVSKVVEID